MAPGYSLILLLWGWRHGTQLSPWILKLPLLAKKISQYQRMTTRPGLSCCWSSAEGYCRCGWVDRKWV